MNNKIRLGTYPYSYVRVVVMRSKLLKKEDYHKLMKMKLNEMIKYLEESEYKREIDELSTSFSGVELLELAVNKNTINSFLKLKKISPEELRPLINAYLKRYDIWNIKTIIRGKYAGASQEQIKKLLLPAGQLKEADLMELIKKESIKEILKSISLIEFKELMDALEYLNKEGTLTELENALDIFYYNYITHFVKKLPKEGRLFGEFLESEIKIMNILTIIRLKREGLGKESIKKFMILTKEGKISAETSRLLNEDSLEKISEKMKAGNLQKIVAEGIKKYNETKSLIDLESSLYKHLLEKSILFIHQHPLSVDVILGYLFAKEVEIKNIKNLLRGKQLGVDDDFIEKELVVA